MTTHKNLQENLRLQSQHSLQNLGWNAYFQSQFETLSNDALVPARVVGVRKNFFHVSRGQGGTVLATPAGKLTHQSDDLYPVTGDWVLLDDTVIYAVLPRKNSLSRGAAGTRGKKKELASKEQVIAANLDTVFVVCGLDRDFNLRRIERYLTLVYNCGLNPVVILTKADLHADTAPFATQVETIAFGAPVHLISALDSQGLVPLEKYLPPGQTIVMVGSSGAGKSTLVNRLSGKTVQITAPVSDRLEKGMHTTTTRDLIQLPQGGMIIDNPGIREISFWDDDGGIDTAFPEIESLAGECRFSDCNHIHEPGCRVLDAVASGELTPARLESYRKMKRELEYLASRQTKSADRIEKENWKKVALKIKHLKKTRKK